MQLSLRLELFDALGGGATKRQGEDEVVVVETVGKAVFNAEDESTSALMYVCWREDWNVSETIVKTLLQRGALVRVSDSKLWSALHFCCI